MQAKNITWMRLAGLALAALLVLGQAGCGDIYGHEEFEKLVKNKSEDDVVKALGKPSSVDNSNPARVVWSYKGMTYDIDNHNNRDAVVNLVMSSTSGGKLQVSEVEYAR